MVAINLVGYLSVTLGYVPPSVVSVLGNFPAWEISDADGTVVLIGRNVEERSAAMEEGLQSMREQGYFSILQSWRNETFPVFGLEKQVLLHIERCACPLFGVVTYGVHAVGYVSPQGPGQQLKVWVSRRARSKQTFGGMLDSTAAGGIASGESPLETLVHECKEEASLPPDLVRQNVKAVGTVTHFYVRDLHSGGEIGLLQPE